MLHVCSSHSLITGCDFIESRKLNIVLTLSDVNVGADALSAWLKSVDSAIGAYWQDKTDTKIYFPLLKHNMRDYVIDLGTHRLQLITSFQRDFKVYGSPWEDRAAELIPSSHRENNDPEWSVW